MFLKLEKVQGATRLGATGLRASERVSERTSETSQKTLKTSQKSLKTSENLWKPLKTSQKSLKTLPLRDPLRGRFPLRGSQSCCPYSVAPSTLSDKRHPETNYHSWFLAPRSKLQKKKVSGRKMHFPTEKCNFPPKNAPSRRKKHFPAEKCTFP